MISNTLYQYYNRIYIDTNYDKDCKGRNNTQDIHNLIQNSRQISTRNPDARHFRTQKGLRVPG